jgi:hypothetical protein
MKIRIEINEIENGFIVTVMPWVSRHYCKDMKEVFEYLRIKYTLHEGVKDH